MDIKKERQIIDETDKEIASLFERRMAAASVIADKKRREGVPVRDEKREAELLEKVASYVNEETKPYIKELYYDILGISREYQKKKLSFGLIGKTLRHSYSPEIQKMLSVEDYSLYELEENDVESFIKRKMYSGINVTIPYKKAVIPFIDELSDTAKRIGSVNTIIRRDDNTLYGDNTDYYGFYHTLENIGFVPSNKKCVILGSGGAMVTVKAVLEDLGAKSIVVISRTGENNYQNINRHFDADLIVNTTPVGMYPKNGVSPIELSDFKKCRCVIDLIYNPSKTKLLLDAEKLNVPCCNGLLMLVSQAKKSAELFLGKSIPDTVIPEIMSAICKKSLNIVLIGMPGSGKTTVGKALAEKLSRHFSDTDELTEQTAGKSPEEIIRTDGIAVFRAAEKAAICSSSKEKALVIATGGGAVLDGDNVDMLRQNGILVYIKRDISLLETKGRPLSADIEKLASERLCLYEKYADHSVQNDDTPEAVSDRIIKEAGL